MFSTAFLDIPALARAAGTVVLPGSKSISNRVLLLAALSSGTTTVHDLLDSDDTRVMLDALRALGCGIKHAGSRVEVTGLGGRAPAPAGRVTVLSAPAPAPAAELETGPELSGTFSVPVPGGAGPRSAGGPWG